MSHKRRHRPKVKNAAADAPTSLETKPKKWTTPTVLGLVLGAVGALGVVELRPQLTVVSQEELATDQPFSTPFEITNTGYLSLHIDNVIMIYHKVEYSGINITDAKVGSKDWDNFDLERGGSKTIFANFANGQPTKADIVMAIDYKFLGKRWRWLYRFVGLHIQKWRWAKEPLGNLESFINDSVDDALVRHKKALQHRN